MDFKIDIEYFIKRVKEFKNIASAGRDDPNLGINELKLLINYGLLPSSTILDVGCGPGRVAISLVYYLNNEGRYFGYDPLEKSIQWCKENISIKNNNFKFDHINIYNELYNKNGNINMKDLTLPYKKESFDFIILFSVFTHLTVQETLHYMDKIFEYLKVGGRVISTWFSVNDADSEKMKNGGFLKHKEGVLYTTYGNPLFFYGYKDSFIIDEFEKRGLKIVEIINGNWSSKQIPFIHQDTFIVEK